MVYASVMGEILPSNFSHFPLEQAGYLGMRPANTKGKHLAWGGGGQNSVISAHWTWLSKCEADSQVMFPLFFCSVPLPFQSLPPIGENLKGKTTCLPLQLCLAGFFYVVEMNPKPPIPSSPSPGWERFAGVPAITYNCLELNLPLVSERFHLPLISASNLIYTLLLFTYILLSGCFINNQDSFSVLQSFSFIWMHPKRGFI